ncbi:MAG: hypothetical protein ABIH23_30680 [bacterium]
MELFLDDKPAPIAEANDATIYEVISRVSEDLRKQNRVISEVFVDDVACGDWGKDPFAQRRIQEVNSLRLKSEEPRSLAIKVLYDIAKYMTPLQEGLVEISSLLQSRREDEAFGKLHTLMETWSELYQGLKGATTVIGINQAEIHVGQNTAESIHKQVLQLLEDATNHLEEQRLLELSDLLEYELAPKMPMVEEAIYLMIRQAKRPQH